MTTIRATRRPAIQALNRTLKKLHAIGVNSYQENVKERGFWAKLMSRRPLRRRA